MRQSNATNTAGEFPFGKPVEDENQTGVVMAGRK